MQISCMINFLLLRCSKGFQPAELARRRNKTTYRRNKARFSAAENANKREKFTASIFPIFISVSFPLYVSYLSTLAHVTSSILQSNHGERTEVIRRYFSWCVSIRPVAVLP